jgi:hypothetical protein
MGENKDDLADRPNGINSVKEIEKSNFLLEKYRPNIEINPV